MEAKNTSDRQLCIVGYSGHAYVVIETLRTQGFDVSAYCDLYEKTTNPYKLNYLGAENNQQVLLKLKQQQYRFFITIGNNDLRKAAYKILNKNFINSVIASHPSSVVSSYASVGECSFIASGAIIQAQANIGVGVICNSGSIIEHESQVGNFAHIGPGAVLCGNVQVGAGTLIGAGAVVNPGIVIGSNAIVGSGSVVTRNVPDGWVVAGNPASQLKVSI